MSDCKKCRVMFAEALYEELNAEQKLFFKDHLLLCKKCRTKFEKMTSTLKIMNQRIRPEPGEAFWNGYQTSLAKRIKEEEILGAKSESWVRTFIRTLSSAPRWSYQTTAALVLVIIGVFIGRMVFSPSVSELQQGQQISSITSQAESRIELVNRTHNYINRSKLILLAMINFDPETEDPYALDLPYQKQISRELVQEASFLKGELADSDQRRLQNLVVDLEVILLQIANLESEHDFEAIELVKDGVESRGVLLKIRLTDIRQFIKKRSKTEPDAKVSHELRII